jgi:hypothetical protein
MSRKRILLTAALLCAGLLARVQGAAPEAGEQPAAKGDKPAASPKEEKDYPDFKEVTEGMKSMPGLFMLWCYPESVKGKDKDKEKLLCQIPSSFLDQTFMLSTSVAGGGFYTGFPLNERAVKWEEFNRRLLLVEPQTGYVVDEKSTVGDVVRRTHPDKILAAVSIVTKSPGGDPVIDLGPLLKSNFADIDWTAEDTDGRSTGSGPINAGLSKWAKKKAFPENVEICVELALPDSNPPGSFQKRLVHYSFWNLRKTDYKPRVGDDRVGYFLTANQDWSKPTGGRDIFNRYIDRWNLQKRDSSLEVCEPVKPIVFYVEKTVPVRFRRAVQDGILEWNKAYDKIGFSNAVQVRQQTDDNEWKDLDPEDMRYSFFRWIVTGSGFAMGPHRANPFTGEIYDADIVCDDSMVRYFEQDLEQMTPSAITAMKMDHPVLRMLLAEFPEWRRAGCEWPDLDGARLTESRDTLRNRMFERQRFHCCDYMEGMKHQMALAGTMLAGQPREVVDKFLYDVIKEVACHEVGHTLGLRHNFAGSFIYSLEEIKKRRATDQPTTGSIMDYNPVLFFKENTFAGRFITPTIGPYDYWAIEYGYRPYDEAYLKKQAEPKDAKEKDKDKEKDKGKDKTGAYLASLSGEAKMLELIAQRTAEPELLYATDEDTMSMLSPDPRSNRFDLGSDPFEYAQGQFDLINDRIAKLLDWGSRDGESWYHARAAFLRLLLEKVMVLDYVGRYAGGQYFHRDHRGDPNARTPFVMVDPKLQRKALTFVEDSLFKDEFFTFAPDFLNHLAPPRWYHTGTSFDMSYVTVAFPIHEYIGSLQWWHLSDRLSPYVLMRIYDAEMQTSDPEELTAAEYIQRIQDVCWKETLDPEKNKSWTPGQPFVSDIRRSLQREYLGIMETLARTRPGNVLPADLHAMVWCSLEDLGVSIEETLKKPSLDFASRSHLRTCKSRIDRMLKVELPEVSARLGGTSFSSSAAANIH